jgi:hypothetical protein
MLKNLFLLGMIMTWVSFSFAKAPHVARESMSDAESYKLEKSVEEQDAQRSVAGAKIKKKKVKNTDPEKSESSSESDSEVRYWQYSE